jgi:hypothetical protein
MRTHAIDRWADTTLFRLVLLLAGLAVVPTLLMGVVATVIGSAAFVIERSTLDFAQAAFALLSAGGALGFLGYWRAHGGALKPHGHNVTATLTCLAAGIVAALVVAGYTVASAVSGLREPWSDGPWVILPALFAAANLVWALSGIAWMQRLARRYAEKTGRTFDTLPVMFLLVSLALAIAAALMTTTL